MRLTKSIVLGAVASLSLAASAFAAQMNGSIAVSDFYGGGSYGAGSYSLSATNLITGSPSGTFATAVPSLGDLTASTAPLSGIGSTPTIVSVPDYFLFSSPDATFSSSGSTPTNRFNFTLQSVEQTTPNSFSGAGTVYDSTGTYDPTPAIFNLSYSGPSNYSFTFAATPVPEPATFGLIAMGIGGLAMCRRRA
jgi:hypothetical protein